MYGTTPFQFFRLSQGKRILRLLRKRRIERWRLHRARGELPEGPAQRIRCITAVCFAANLPSRSRRQAIAVNPTARWAQPIQGADELNSRMEGKRPLTHSAWTILGFVNRLSVEFSDSTSIEAISTTQRSSLDNRDQQTGIFKSSETLRSLRKVQPIAEAPAPTL